MTKNFRLQKLNDHKVVYFFSLAIFLPQCELLLKGCFGLCLMNIKVTLQLSLPLCCCVLEHKHFEVFLW